MRKVVVHKPGNYEVLRLEEHPDPPPKEGEVTVRVAAAGVNYADCVVRVGLYDSAKKFVGWPITPGFEVAGEVAAIGSAVTRFKVGDPVFAVTLFGGYASRLNIPEHQVFRKPDALEFAEAAAVPAVFLTAYYALYELCRMRPGAKVLVHSAAGGVGSALVQLAKANALFVVGVVGSSHKVDAVRKLGADVVIDKSVEPLWEVAKHHAPDGYDIVLDANGPETLRASYAHTAMAGRLVVYGAHSMMSQSGTPNWPKLAWDFLKLPRFNPLDLIGQNKSVLGFNLSFLFAKREILSEGMATCLELIGRGQAKVPAITRYPVDRVGQAHRDLESGKTVGKLVLTFGG